METLQDKMNIVNEIIKEMPYAKVTAYPFGDNNLIIQVVPNDNYKIYRPINRAVLHSVEELKNFKNDVAVSVIPTEEEQNSNASESTEV